MDVDGRVCLQRPPGWAVVEWWDVWVGMKDGKLNPGLSGSLIKRDVSCGSGQTQEAGEASLYFQPEMSRQYGKGGGGCSSNFPGVTPVQRSAHLDPAVRFTQKSGAAWKTTHQCSKTKPIISRLFVPLLAGKTECSFSFVS